MLSDYFRFTVNNIRHRRLRSWLTILGIIIGIAAVVSLISIGQGLENAVKAQFAKMGTQVIMVMPKGMETGFGGSGLTDDDVNTLERMPYFEYVTPLLVTMGEVEYKREKKFVSVRAFPTERAEERFRGMDFSIEDGRFFNPNEKYGVILGHKVAEDAFERKLETKSRIKINDADFTVVGIFTEIGAPDDDNAIYIPLDTGRTLFNKPKEVNFIMLRVKEGTNIDSVAQSVKRELKRSRGNENFDLFTPEQILKQMGMILGVVQIILVGIAAISLVVGGIGIMNTMYTSVLERTKEIGIMKAIGATNYDIAALFLMESGLIGFVGGAVGVIIGSAVAMLVSIIAKEMGFSFLLILLDPVLIGGALLFAFGVGAASGFLPARQAAKMQPVDALRYE